jgi:hypothetical protein
VTPVAVAVRQSGSGAVRARSVVVAALALTLVALLLPSVAPAAGAAESWGRTLVRTHTVPRDEIAKFNALRTKAREPNQSTLENILAQDSVAWSMPPLDVVQKNNPYRIVVRVEAQVAGPDATSLFLAGWTRLDKHGDPDGPTAMGTVAGLGGPGEAAGGGAPRLVKTAAAGPVSFKADGKVVPSIELSRRQGLTFERVEVEIWSGLPATSWREWFFGWQSALIGLVMLALWFLWFRKRD